MLAKLYHKEKDLQTLLDNMEYIKCMGILTIESGDGGKDAKMFAADLAKAIQKTTSSTRSTIGETHVLTEHRL